MLTALIVVVVQCSLALGTPELSCNVTKYATFHCNMAGFNNRLSSLLTLQIVKKAQDSNGQGTVIATVDSHDAWLSQDVISRNEYRHHVSGQLDLSRKRDAWLKLTVANFTQNDFGTYSCQIHYTDHPADTKHTTWSSDVLVDGSVSERKETPGFKIALSKGVHMRCESGRSDDNDSQDPVASMRISTMEQLWFASWDEEHEDTNCSRGLLSSYHREEASSTGGILEVHIPEVTCKHQTDHVCRVTTSSGRELESQPRRLPLAECGEPPNTEPSVVGKTTTRVTSSTKDGRSSLGVKIAIGVVCGVLGVVIVVALGCFILYRKRKCSRLEVSKTKAISAEEDEDNFWNEFTEKTSDTEEPLVECAVKITVEDTSEAASKAADKLLNTEEKRGLLESPSETDSSPHTSLSHCDCSDDTLTIKPCTDGNNPNIAKAEPDTSSEDRNEKCVVVMNYTDKPVSEDKGYHSNGSSGNSSPESEKPFNLRSSASSGNDDMPESLQKNVNINVRSPHSLNNCPELNEKESDLKDNSHKFAGLKAPVQATDLGNVKAVEV